MRRLLLIAAAVAALTISAQAAGMKAYDPIADTLTFFWSGGKYMHWLNADGSVDDAMQDSTRIGKTDDPCVVRVDQPFVSPNVNGFGHKITVVNFRKMPAASEFVISDSSNFRNFTIQAEANLSDGAMCQEGMSRCWATWRIWDNRGEEHVRRRLMALDQIRNKFCS